MRKAGHKSGILKNRHFLSPSRNPYLCLLLLCVTAYWPVSFILCPLKWDMLDQHLPWRYFIGECLRNGYLPLWNPYQNMGYPIYADPQSGVWYPFTWIAGLIAGYSIYTIHFQFVLHVFIGGCGMHRLGKELGISNAVSFMMGASYMLSGFFIGNAQHLIWILCGAWIPWVIQSYLSMLKNGSVRNIIIAAINIYLLITAGYPAFAIITAYILLSIFFAKTSAGFFLKKNLNAPELIKSHMLLFTGTLLLCSPVIIALFDAVPLISRGAGVPCWEAPGDAFSPRSMLSFILPMAVVKDTVFFGTDISMSNAYFGITGFLLLCSSLPRKKKPAEWFFLIMGIFFLLVSFGDHTPLRLILHKYLPLIHLFRGSSVLRVFMIISFIIVAGFRADELSKERTGKTDRFILIFSVLFSAVITGLMVFSMIHVSREGLNNLFTFSITDIIFYKLNIYQAILIQGFIQVVILTIFISVLYNAGLKRHLGLLVWLVAADLFIAAQLNIPATVIYKARAWKISEQLSALPKGFPLPSGKSVADVSGEGNPMGAMSINLSNFRKKTSHDGYNPFTLSRYLSFEESSLAEYTLRNPLAFLSGDIFTYDSISVKEKNNQSLFVSGNDYEKFVLKNKILHIPGDTLHIVDFGPGKVKVEISSHGRQFLTMVQNNYPGWKAFLDGRPAEIFTSNYTLISVPVPPGEHTVEFRYVNNFYLFSLAVSIVFFLSFLFIISRPLFKRIFGSNN